MCTHRCWIYTTVIYVRERLMINQINKIQELVPKGIVTVWNYYVQFIFMEKEKRHALYVNSIFVLLLLFIIII